MFENNTEQKLTRLGWLLHAAGFLVSGASVAAIIVFGFGSLDAQSIDLVLQTAELKQCVKNADKINATNRELRETIAEMNRRSEHLSAQIPESARESDYLAQLSRLARETELEIENYQPGVAKEVKDHSALDIALTIKGNYQSLCRFLDGLQNLPRVCRINMLRILKKKLKDDHDGVLSIDMSMTIYYAPNTKADPARTRT